MEKEIKSLSEKRFIVTDITGWVYPEKDIKEFIKIIEGEIKLWWGTDINNLLNALRDRAGPKLTK